MLHTKKKMNILVGGRKNFLDFKEKKDQLTITICPLPLSYF